MNTIELNLLIAAFMGGEKSKKDGPGNWIRFKERHAGTELFAFHPKDLKYHTSWDWLMPVVEKIESVGGAVHIDADYIFLHYPNRKEKMVRHDYGKINTSKIQAVYAAVVQFIQWYTTQSPNR